MQIKFFEKKNSFEKKDFQFNSSLYWKFALFFAFSMILGSFFFGYNFFVKINQESTLLNSDTTEQISTVSTDRLKNALNYFLERERKSSQILNSSSPVVDPSL